MQYHVLKMAYQTPDLMTYTDNIRILEAIQKHGIIDSNSVTCLQEAYVNYRSLGHRLSLQGAGNVIDLDDYDDLKPLIAGVSGIWERYMLD